MTGSKNVLALCRTLDNVKREYAKMESKDR